MSDTIESDRDWYAHWNTVPSRAGPVDFFHQVERTVGGLPMDVGQIDLVLEATRAALDLNCADHLLDLCCGNGLITARLARMCQSVIGIDFSKYLIGTAKRYHNAPNITYVYAPATAFTPAAVGDWQPTKICMLTALQYFTSKSLKRLIMALTQVSHRWGAIYFSDIPDRDHLFEFYNTPQRRQEYEARRTAGTEAIGTWWSRQQLLEIFLSNGYIAQCLEQDERRFGANYRFDLLVFRQN